MAADLHDMQTLLEQLLAPRIGYASRNWPGSLSRLLHRLAAEDKTDERTVLKRLLSHGQHERLDQLVAAATVPHTSFFRHPEQFEGLSSLLPQLAKRRHGHPLQLWSAGCATGEEAYSLALCARDAGVDAEILATDVSPECIRVARRGTYSAARSARLRHSRTPTGWAAPLDLRARVRFEVSSLVSATPALGEGPFDVILCRNVLVYFDRIAACKVLERLAGYLHPHGVIVVAPSEVVAQLPEQLERIEPAGFVRERTRHGTSVRPRSTRPKALLGRSEHPPSHPQLELAAELLGSGHLRACEAELQALLHQSPVDPVVWFLLAEALIARGERAQARTAFLRAAECAHAEVGGIEAETLARVARRRAGAL